MNTPTDIPLCPRAHDAIRRCLEAAQPDPAADPSLALGQHASDKPHAQRSTLHASSLAPGDPATDPPLCCCIQAALRGRPGWPFPAADWDTRRTLASVLTDKALRRAYAAEAIREAQVPAIVGKDLAWGVVYCRRGNRQYARLHVIPADPLTPARQRMRAIMRAVSQAANTLPTPEQRRAWVAAKKVWSRRRLTRGKLTWQMLFVKLNAVLVLVGREILLWPAARPARFGPNPVAALVPSYENEQFRLALKVSGPVVEDIMVFGEAPVGPKRKKLRHPVYLGVLRASAGGLSDITAWYVGRFGEPAPGQKVLIGVQQQVNGWKGRMKVLGAVVAGRPVEAPRNTRNTRNGAGMAEMGNDQGARGQGDVGGRKCMEVSQFQRVRFPRCTRDRFRSASVVLPSRQAGAPGSGQASAVAEKGYLRPGWRLGGMAEPVRSGPKPAEMPPARAVARHVA